MKFRFEFGQRSLFLLHQGIDLDANCIHQTLALAAFNPRQYVGHLIVLAQHDDLRQLRQFGIDQWHQGSEMSLTGFNPNVLAQIVQIARNAVATSQIRLKKGLITGQRIAALASLSIAQLGKHAFYPVDDMSRMTTRRSRRLHLSNRPERYRRRQHNQQNSSQQECNKSV